MKKRVTVKKKGTKKGAKKKAKKKTKAKVKLGCCSTAMIRIR